MNREIEFVLMVTWLQDFFLECLSRDIEKITHSLVMMQPDSPMTCNCENEMSQSVYRSCAPTEHDKLFHGNHMYYNSVIWRILHTHGLIREIRVVLQNDMMKRNESLGREWGEITSHEYAKRLLDNLVTENPNPRWVDPEMEWDIRTGKPGIEPRFVGEMYTRKES